MNRKLLRFSAAQLKCGVRSYSVAVKANLSRNKNKMQAWQVHSYKEELQLTPARIPVISQPTDVLVQVQAASVNPIDTYMRVGYGKNLIGMFREDELEFPLTLGRDFAGIIVDKGYDVDASYKIGDSVYGIVPILRQGSHAQKVVVNESNICHRPKHLSPVESCSILYAAMTAWSALYVSGNLMLRSPKLTKVLIMGASGGVGTAALQILKSQGSVVVGTCSTNAVEMVKSLGIDNVHDYTSKTFEQDVASEGRFDIILDCARVGHEKLPKSWQFDTYVTLNSPLLKNTDEHGLLAGLMTSARDLLVPNFFTPAKGWVKWGFFVDSKTGLEFIDKLIHNKQIIPVIHKVFKFNDIPKAYETIEGGHLRGKVVVDFEDVVHS